MNGVNGHHESAPARLLKPGIYAPIPTFFLSDSEDLDLQSFKTHVLRIASAGVGPLLSGSMGEAHHLTADERVTLIRTARQTLDDAGLQHVPIIAGTGAGSTRETLKLTADAAAAGADCAIVIASGYFSGVLASSKPALKAFWSEIAAKSSIPVMIYNFPGASGGIDLDSEIIVELAKECPNIAGVKLTCGNVGKLTRIAATVSPPSFEKAHPRLKKNAPFLVLGGFADFLVPSTFSMGHGAITGLANVSPYALVHLYSLCERAVSDPSALPEATRVQGIIARADQTIARASIAGTKSLLERLHGFGGSPRKPLPPMDGKAAQQLWDHPDVVDLLALERQLTPSS